MKIASTAPKQSELNPRHTLPEQIFFFVHVSTYPCSFPLPKEYPEEQYLHRAAIYSGHEAAGPAIQLRFSPRTVIGLKPHHMNGDRCPAQLILQVPVTRRVNPFLAPKQLTFQPSTASQLHNSDHLPRIVVPVTPLGMHSHGGQYTATLIRNTKKAALKALICPWDSTPRGQRMLTALTRWKRVCDAIYSEVHAVKEPTNVQTELSDATVGTPYRFGSWYPRAALDVPPYTTVYFQNARVSITAPKPKHLPTRHLLPREIYFYVRTMTTEVCFPLPEKDYPSARYLHVARVVPGHEAGGPAAHMVWSIHSVVGLKKHHCTPSGAPPRSMQLVLVVPSTAMINPGIEPTQLAFSPTNFAQLHLSRRLPRIIVPLYPRKAGGSEAGRYIDALSGGRRLKAMKALIGAWRKFDSRELKLASFKRWTKVSQLLPSRKLYRPAETQIGSPFIEDLQDRGLSTNRARCIAANRLEPFSVLCQLT